MGHLAYYMFMVPLIHRSQAYTYIYIKYNIIVNNVFILFVFMYYKYIVLKYISTYLIYYLD